MDFIQGIEKHLKIDPSGIDISGTGNIVLHSSGHVSIGHTAPVFPLDVHGTEDHTSTNGYYVDNDRAASAGHDEFQSASGVGNPRSININATNWVRAQQGFLIDSDQRIKKDVDEVPDNYALFQVNELETKYYHYRDPLRKNKHKTIGFMAQDVKEVVPNAVSLINEYVPDELRAISNPVWTEEGDKWRLTIDDLAFSDNHTKMCRLCLGKTNKFTDLKVEEDNKSFVVSSKTDDVFLWGKEVNDFHSLDKNMIFALHHSAIQELSKKNDKKDEEIKALVEQLKEKSDLIASFESRMSSLESVIVTLQNK